MYIQYHSFRLTKWSSSSSSSTSRFPAHWTRTQRERHHLLRKTDEGETLICAPPGCYPILRSAILLSGNRTNRHSRSYNQQVGEYRDSEIESEHKIIISRCALPSAGSSAGLVYAKRGNRRLGLFTSDSVIAQKLGWCSNRGASGQIVDSCGAPTKLLPQMQLLIPTTTSNHSLFKQRPTNSNDKFRMIIMYSDQSTSAHSWRAECRRHTSIVAQRPSINGPNSRRHIVRCRRQYIRWMRWPSYSSYGVFVPQ